MHGLDHGEKDILEARMNRLTYKEDAFQISRRLAEYIDKLETHLLEQEDRMAALETMLGLRGLEPPQFE